MVLERSVLLPQQEEEEFGPDKGIHGAHRKQKTLGEKRKQKWMEYMEVTVFLVESSVTLEEARNTVLTVFNIIKSRVIHAGTGWRYKHTTK